MNINEFTAARKSLGFTQGQMAAAMDVSTRAVQKLEGGESEIRRIHELALQSIAIDMAFAGQLPSNIDWMAPDFRVTFKFIAKSLEADSEN